VNQESKKPGKEKVNLEPRSQRSVGTSRVSNQEMNSEAMKPGNGVATFSQISAIQLLLFSQLSANNSQLP
jgi:hypothetical protein